ncbi:phosphotransferase family protein [Actinoalloteichus hymeniacidonis]|uniref:Aminoglycoside phosphotransferase domain-containing protein n=1 Tax=Actinoalloteichus hymeniacidonis TaxID=340345 RepID=A0AAC9MYN1_9PSEU|nr:phosphotransferase [Actinoalloteichus hymeniacidonis]AOS63076.1 hypothetical protein TL08_11310 [Actinoalloteichus hymeniacidonis]MBB5908888.1 hypothetical protein [Actinoalloteichus hymeniacidonis]
MSLETAVSRSKASDRSTTSHDELNDTVRAAETVLTGRFGASVRLADPEDLGGSGRAAVVRVRVAETPFTMPKTLVIKRYPRVADDQDGGAFAREAASCQLLTALPAESWVSPELVGQDQNERLVILEDFGRASTLADVLRGEDTRAAENTLLSWARTLGRLHTSTAGRDADFDALLRRLGGRDGIHPVAQEAAEAVRELPALLATLHERPVPDEVLADVGEALKLFSAQRYRAFSTSDISPDNSVVTGHGVRFLDFESGCVRDIALDAISLLVPFASCACALRVPEEIGEAMLATWRSEVTSVWPELDQDEILLPRLFQAQLIYAWVATWRVLSGTSGVMTSETEQGDPMLRYLDVIDQWERLASDAGVAEPLAEFADSTAAALRDHFGLSGQRLPFYPAFR